jgi:CBS-domain-containing membrane protein
VHSDIVSLSWRYLPTVLSSSLIMLGWALIINNLGRRRYPLHWWAAGVTFVRSPHDENHQAMRRNEEAQAAEGERVSL